MKTKDLPEVQLGNVPAVPTTPETKRTAIAYLKALGATAEKAIEDAERLGHDFVLSHYHAGTDPYDEERAAAAPAEETNESKPDDDATPAGTQTAVADAETSAPAAAASTSDVPTKAAVNSALAQMHGRINSLGCIVANRAAAGDLAALEKRVAELETALKQHIDTNHLAAHPAPPAPSAADLDAVASDQAAAAATSGGVSVANPPADVEEAT